MKYFKKLVGERIYLSPRSSEDAEIFTNWMNDFEVTEKIPGLFRSNPYFLAEAQKRGVLRE